MKEDKSKSAKRIKEERAILQEIMDHYTTYKQLLRKVEEKIQERATPKAAIPTTESVAKEVIELVRKWVEEED